VYSHLKALLPKYACQEYLDCFKMLEDEELYSENAIPQLEDVSNFLKRNHIYIRLHLFIYILFLPSKQ